MSGFEVRTLDLPTFIGQINRQAVGFDQMFNLLNHTLNNAATDTKYPPHNVVQLDETHYAIELAIAGFAEDEVSVELTKNVLTVTGEQRKQSDHVIFFHKGISNRGFTKTFPLGEHIEVTCAAVKNGILTISLERIVPDDAKPKSIAITFES